MNTAESKSRDSGHPTDKASSGSSDNPSSEVRPQKGAPESKAASLAEIEREHIKRILEQTLWRIEGLGGAAKILGINPGTLRSRMKKLGIHRPDKQAD